MRSAGEQEASNHNLAATKIGKAIRKNAYQIAAKDCNAAWPQPTRARLERILNLPSPNSQIFLSILLPSPHLLVTRAAGLVGPVTGRTHVGIPKDRYYQGPV